MKEKIVLSIGVNGSLGYYVGLLKTNKYLHTDGRILNSTMNERGNYTGYFTTLEDAKNIIKTLNDTYDVTVNFRDSLKEIVKEADNKELNEALDFWIDIGESIIENAPDCHWICNTIYRSNSKFKKEAIQHFKKWFAFHKEHYDDYMKYWNGGNALTHPVNSDNEVVQARLMAIAFMYVFTERKAHKKA